MAEAREDGERQAPPVEHDRPRETLGVFALFAALAAVFLHGALTGPRLLAAEGGEALSRYYPVRHVYGRMLAAGELPLWNPFAFIGQPFWSRFDAGSLYPPNLVLYYLLPAPAAFDTGMVLHVALAGFFAYLLARALGAGRAGAVGGGIVFCMTGFMLAARDLTPVMEASAWLPLALWCAERLRRTPGMRNASALALVLALQALAGDPYIALISALVAVAFVALGGPGRPVAAPAMALLGAGLAALLALPQIVAAYGQFSFGAAYAAEPLAHFPPAALLSFVVPGALAGRAGAIVPLLGPLPLALALAAAFLHGDRRVRFLAVLALAGTALALAPETPLRAIHPIGALPAPGRLLLLVSMAVAMLAALGLDAILLDNAGERERALTFVAYALGAVLALALGAALITYIAGRPDTVPPGLTLTAVALSAMALGWAVWLRRAGGAALGYAAFVILLLEAVAIGGIGGPQGPSFADAKDLCDREPFGAFAGADPGLYRTAAVSLPGGPALTNPGAALTCALGSIALADPVADRDLARLLDLDPRGDRSRRWPELVRNNILLGMLGVRYLTVPSGADIGIGGVAIEEGGAIRERVAVRSWLPYLAQPGEGEGSFRLAPGGEIASAPLALDAAMYGVSFRASAGEAAGPLLVLVVRTDGADAVEVERLEPGIIGAEPRDFFAVAAIAEPGSYRIVIQSRSAAPVLVSSPHVMRLNHYTPFALAEGGPAMDGMEAYEKLWDDGHRSLWTNRNSLPRAWSVGELIEIASPRQAKNLLYSFQVNPARQAMVGPEELKDIGRRIFAHGAVDITGFAPGRISLATDFPEEGFVVLSEMRDSGWEARIDGSRVPLYGADGVLMGVVVPPGRHAVLFRFFPRGQLALAGFSLALALALLAHAALPRRAQRNIDRDTPGA